MLFVLLLLGSIGGSSASAQEVRVQIDRGPHYIGQPVEIQVVASDFEDDPAPEIVAGQVDSGQLRYGGVSNSSSTSISFVNGRMSRVKEVRFVYRFEYTGTKEGRVRIPGFALEQGTTKRTTKPFDLQIMGVPKTGLVSLDVRVPEGPIFVGQKVPVEIEFRIDREAQQDLLSYQAIVPLFDLPNVRFLDDPTAKADTQLEIETSKGTLGLPAVSSEERVRGRSELVVRAKRTMIALTPEAIRADPARVVINRGTRFRRDLFNQRQAGSSQRLMAEGDPVRVEVIEVPREGRPPSFAGAVGEGFTLEVSTDRSVVQLGEPILLTFLVRGNGDLSSAGMPPLGAEGMLDPEQFRLPADPPAGLLEDEGKRFEASLRVLDADVREIPAIAYSWFDAESRAFETTHSLPIALSVGAAEIIGADDVARTATAGSQDREERVDRKGTAEASGDGPVRSTSLAFSGANLAVERDPDKVLGIGTGPHGEVAAIAVPVLYALGLGVFAFAAVDHRRRGVDPRSLARGRALSEAKRAIEAAAKHSDAEGAAALGRALRELVANLPGEADAEYDALIAECDALRFDPSASTSGLPSDLVGRALAFVSARSKAVEPDAEEAT